MITNSIYYPNNTNTLITGVLSVVPQWVKVTKTYTDFALAGLTNDIEIYSLPAKGIINAVIIKHSIAFSGGALATYTVSAGQTGSLVRYNAVFDVMQAIGDAIYQPFKSIPPTLQNYTSADSVRGSVISTGANLDQAVAGSVDFYLLLSKLP